MNESAFPSPGVVLPSGQQQGAYQGMTLRDYFAAKALQGFASDSKAEWNDGTKGMARAAYGWADAMLTEREK